MAFKIKNVCNKPSLGWPLEGFEGEFWKSWSVLTTLLGSFTGIICRVSSYYTTAKSCPYTQLFNSYFRWRNAHLNYLINVSLWLVLRLIMSGNLMASKTVSSKFNASSASWMTKAWLTMVPFWVRPPEKGIAFYTSSRNSHFPHPFAFTLIYYAYI